MLRVTVRAGVKVGGGLKLRMASRATARGDGALLVLLLLLRLLVRGLGMWLV